MLSNGYSLRMLTITWYGWNISITSDTESKGGGKYWPTDNNCKICLVVSIILGDAFNVADQCAMCTDKAPRRITEQ